MTRAALNLYRRILRASRRFGPDEGRTIRDEARSLFEKNAALTDAQEIDAKLFEGNTRYRIASFPRAVLAMPMMVAQG